MSAEEEEESTREEAEEEKEEEEEEVSLGGILLYIINDLNTQIKIVDDDLDEINGIANKIREMLYKPVEKGKIPEELNNPKEFMLLLDSLSVALGDAVDYVLRVEKTRRQIEYLPYDELLAEVRPQDEESAPRGRPQSPINVTVAQPPASATPPTSQPYQGYWASRAEIQKAKIWAEVQKQKMKKSETVVTTQQITDIVQFGRQLLPAFNAIKQRIPGAVAHVECFNNDNVCFLLHEEIKTFTSQTLEALVAFVTACKRYRKNLLEGRKLGMARAIAKIAEAESYGTKITTSAVTSKKGFGLTKVGFKANK